LRKATTKGAKVTKSDSSVVGIGFAFAVHISVANRGWQSQHAIRSSDGYAECQMDIPFLINNSNRIPSVLSVISVVVRRTNVGPFALPASRYNRYPDGFFYHEEYEDTKG